MADELLPPAMTIALYDEGYRPRGQIADYISCTASWVYLGVGTGTIVVREDDPRAPVLLSAAAQPILVRIGVNGQHWSGRVATAQLDRQGPPGTGQVTATLVDDWIWLRSMLASQHGASPALTGMPQFDTQTGPVATLAAYYINAAAMRLGAPVAAVVPVGDTSQAATLSARMTVLADLLTVPMQSAGVACPAALWLPGDNQPAGLVLSQPTIVFTPGQPPPKPWLRWSDNDGSPDGTSSLNAVSLVLNAGTAYRIIVGLDGQDAARNYDTYTDQTLAGQGIYALPEAYADESSTTLGDPSQAKALSDLSGFRPSASASFSVVDGVPFSFGKHYLPGDLGRFSASSIELADRISKVTASDDRTKGLVISPVIGDSTAASDSNELLVAAISSIALQVRASLARR